MGKSNIIFKAKVKYTFDLDEIFYLLSKNTALK